ncbi:hypothetical protein MMPV_002803 [Pyropia vietnamensis]
MALRRYAPCVALVAIAATAAMVAAIATVPTPAGATQFRGDRDDRGGRGHGRWWYRHRFGQRRGVCVGRLPLNAPRAGGLYAVANRGGGTVSLIDPDKAAVVDTYELGRVGEPMYLATPFGTREVWVGDRANSQLHVLQVFENKFYPTFRLDLPGCDGVFHTMASQLPVSSGGTVWTTCDKSNITVVHDVTTHTVIGTIPLPKRVAALGGVPHDTIANERFGYVSYIKNSDGAGYVGVYSVRTLSLVRLIRTAEDPHVGLFADSNVIIAAQGGEVSTFRPGFAGGCPRTVDRKQPSPHGVAVALSGSHGYITNIADGGDAAIVTYRLNRSSGSPQRGCAAVKSSRPIPHNLSITSDDRILLLTHSGANSTVVGLWKVNKDGCVDPKSERLIETGANPFGVCFLRALSVPKRS